MRKHSLLQKVMALALTAILVIGMVPNITLPAVAAENEASLTVTDKVTDPETLNNWQDYYGDNSLLPDGSRGISTWKAGGVWTDKSVFENGTSFAAAADTTASVSVDENNFLVSLSALASNKEIVGQSSVPLDTMLVLDLSNSMDQSQSVESMINAANDAIHALLEMNANNRVGVVLYSGNTDTDNPAYKSSATVILPLDRYTTTTTKVENGVTKYQYLTQEGEWIEVRNGHETVEEWDTTVSVADGTRNFAGTKPTGSKNTAGGTYIQNGLYQAYEEFASVTDKGVVQSGTQAGVQRTPVMVLMSDGRPTLATSSYNKVATSEGGYGTGSQTSTSNRTVFLTQLTAAWVKGAVSDHYGTDMKFYSLGMGTSTDTYATNVLYPSGTTDTDVLNWWTKFQTGTERDDGTVEIIEHIEPSGYPFFPGYNPGQEGWYLDYDNDGFATKVGRNYIDRYWSASDANGMIQAFWEIMDEIALQSAYSPTLVESGDANMDGYITIQDELGAMMQVKDVKGILMGDTLFTGEEMSRSTIYMGSSETPTDYGNQFVRTVMARIGTADTSETQQLIGNAYAAGQLSYNETTGEYSNYIGWYGGANDEYLGFWQESYGYDMTNAPAGAEYINKSYGYLGRSHEDSDADMMHIVVMVHTEIATGDQTVLFKIPSSLIPMVTYKVEMEGDFLENATSMTLTVEETDPIRLLYEVGLPDDVNNVNLTHKVAEYEAKNPDNRVYTDDNGNYIFYANNWDNNNDGTAPVISNLTTAEKKALTESIAESHFIPNTANERFYILEDSAIYEYKGGQYVPVESEPTADGIYYFTRTIINVTNTATGAAESVTQYERLYPDTFANGGIAQDKDGTWIVKAGTIRQSLSNLALEKSENSTDTIIDSDHLWVDITGNTPTDHNIYSFLGNNGKLTVAPTSGIKVTKDVTELADGAEADEKFTITVTLSQAEEDAAVTDAEGNALPEGTWSTTDNKVFTLHLADGETVYITGLTSGTTYTVEEAANSKYFASYTYENADKVVVEGTIQGVTVTNAPVQPGALNITKEVVPSKKGEPFPTDHEFEFKVTFVDADGNPIKTTFQLESTHDTSITELQTDENGVMEVKLKHSDTVYIKGIPAGAVVTVEEVNIPDNYTSTVYRSRNVSGQTADSDGVVTIVSGADATVVVTNTYTPKSTTVDLDIDGTKNFNAEGNEDLLPSNSFTFKVQQWNGTAWDDIDGKTATVEYAAQEDGEKTFKIEDVLSGIEYKEAGTYTYQVVEVKGSVANVTYDRTLYTFTVTVTDINGQLVATVTDLNNAPITGGSYEVVFKNTFNTAPVSIDIEKDVENKSGNPEISKAGFAFVAVQTDENWNSLTGDDASTLTVYSDGAGNARVSATYEKAGSYYYVVTESNNGGAGWTYSGAEYRVTVVVTDDGTGNLSAEMTIVAAEGTTVKEETASVDGNSGKIIFKNTYDPTDAEVDLDVVPTVVKSLTGRDLVAGEFTFAIFKDGDANFTNTDNAIMIGTNDANGNVSFNATAYGVAQGLADADNNTLKLSQVGAYYFDVVEINDGKAGVVYDPIIYDLVVEVTDNGDGTLKAVYYFEDSTTNQITVKNTYTAEPTEVVIEGLKTLKVNSGLKILSAGDYTFGLYNTDDEGNPVGEPLQTTKNLANGSFKFDAIKYTLDDAGKTFTYVVMEIAPDGTTDGSYSVGGVDYSGQSFSVSVTVKDNGDGTLTAEVVGNGASIIKFVNEYTSNPVSVTLPGTKTINGRDLIAGEFKFALYKSDSTFTTRDLVTNEITHDADGNISFSFGTLGMGYHYYVLKEVIPETRAPGIHYDAGEYHITIQVIDSGNGQMTALTNVYHPGTPNVVNPAISFTNEYRAEDGEIALDGTKTYNGGKALEDDVFSVGLYQGETLLQTADVKADGTFTFEPLTYTADDIGKTFTYTVGEIIPEGATDNGDGTKTSGSNIYDATIYTVVVTVADDNKDGVLEITKTVNGTADDPISFTNTFVPTPIEYELQAKKTYEKGLKGNDFKFKLTSADTKTSVEQTKWNDADGNVAFDKITFSEAGTYTFHVEEIDKILGFIDYSTAKYLVTIEVVNENGVLRVVEPITIVNLTDNSNGDLTFVNTYKMDGEGEVTLRGTKTLTGDRTTVAEGEFEFGLYDEQGNLIESVKNDANGNFVFTTLKYDETDVTMNGETVLTYTVKEIAGDNARYTYDETIYTVEITIKDNDQGGIDVSYTITGGENDGKIAFTNTYTDPTPVTYTPEAKKHYNKTMSGGEFTFTLEGEGYETQTKTNDAEGNVKFDTLSFPEAGTYTFTVKEINKILGFISYSSAEHTIVVKVIDIKGVLSIESVTINNDADGTIEFTNTYNMEGEGEVALRGTKTLTGDRTTVNEGEFEFGLYDSEGNLVESVKNDANGNFTFTTLKYDETDVDIDGETVLTYTVKEISGSDPNMTYDPTVYTVVITVKDNDQGGVDVSYTVNGKPSGEIAIVFTNTFTKPADAVANIYIQKQVINKTEPGIGLDGFEFVLEQEGGSAYTVTSNAEGRTGFQVTLGWEHVGQTYTFKVYEKKGTTAGITYDTTVYTVTVAVAMNPDGTLKTVINGVDTNGIELAFTNIYEKSVTPGTGDTFPVILMGSLLLISGAAVVVLMLTKKKKPGKYAR